ncbi:Peroxisome biosynthesis protein PAS1 [Neolecta irregularis DAH-3]|uniref:Peroxisomal ATPase PEX1 n=1 Tax=Neolecta irregularis (strain DAH-3) TaxID=1198029 RepID=A0A1U7LPG0_NEOID|nr:Peroxisome biosynthesis protein PAS1 [Neolecta irregularis DAH-3]|eukprot:OLL24560.1 Peroxisome biosynthesis protein PAS1 [Neolecta irregularis DAH-3]
MAPSSFLVSLVSLKSCLVNLPASLSAALLTSSALPQNIAVELVHSRKQVYAGWTGMVSKSEDTIEIDASFAKEVQVDLHPSPAVAHIVHVEPLTSDDWEIMELHASFLELNLISQVRVISYEHPFTVYLSSSSTISLRLKSFEPSAQTRFVRLSPDAEVIVAPKVRADRVDHKSMGTIKRDNRDRNNVMTLRTVMRKSEERLDIFLDKASCQLGKWAEIAISKTAFDDNKSIAQGTLSAATIVVAVNDWEDVPNGHVGISSTVSKCLSIQGSVGELLRIYPAPMQLKSSTIVIRPFSSMTSIKINSEKLNSSVLKDSLVQLSIIPGPITHNLRIPACPGLADGGLLQLAKEGWIHATETTTFEMGQDIAGELMSLSYTPKRVLGLEPMLEKSSKIIRYDAGILVVGTHGSGKSTFISSLRTKLEDYLIYSQVCDASSLSTERVPTVIGAFSRWFNLAAFHNPSVLILDDLDVLLTAENEHSDSSRTRQLSELFLSVAYSHRIPIVVTTKSKDSLNKIITQSHLFREIITLSAPEKILREEYFGQCVSETIVRKTERFGWGDLERIKERAETENTVRSESIERKFPVTDVDYLKALVGYTPVNLRGVKLQKTDVEWRDIGGLKATKQILLETLLMPTKYAPIFNSCPLRLRSGLLLYGYPGCGKTLLASAIARESGLNWIGVKGPEILNKYIGASEGSVRDLFARAQAARPCVLFFDEFDSIAPKRGHDSTGVTDRVVNQMLTQMDGAEGLEGVWVLAATRYFPDWMRIKFDSRPDLIDSALLRPGRLDKSLFCDMPNFHDRLDILRVLITKLNLGNDVDLTSLADKTTGYTGADLQALLYNAHLEAVHDILENTDTYDVKIAKEEIRFEVYNGSQDKTGVSSMAEKSAILSTLQNILNEPQKESPEQSKVEVVILERHVLKSLEITRPSISRQEQNRLRMTYQEFVSGRSGEMPNGMASQEIGGRATLM